MSHTKHGLATTQVLGLAWLSHWLGCPLGRRMGWSLLCVGMTWLVRVVLAATTSAGSRLPAPGAPGCPLQALQAARSRLQGEVEGVAYW
ncbi:hypothetical protein V8C86DRAFT_2715338 [Haematococcus lacustris]